MYCFVPHIACELLERELDDELLELEDELKREELLELDELDDKLLELDDELNREELLELEGKLALEELPELIEL